VAAPEIMVAATQALNVWKRAGFRYSQFSRRAHPVLGCLRVGGPIPVWRHNEGVSGTTGLFKAVL